MTPEYVEGALDALKEADIVLIQQEIPFETIEYVSDVCADYGIPLLLNPAPAHFISNKVIEQATFITPNEHEAKLLFPNMSLEDVLIADSLIFANRAASLSVTKFGAQGGMPTRQEVEENL